MRFVFLSALFIVGCGKTIDDKANVDADRDGYAASIDCNDNDASVFPGADEVCDGIDNNCDGQVDTGVITNGDIYFADADGDGFGNPASEVMACGVGEGIVDNADDCNDSDARYNPEADESDCTDPADYNCDGSVGYVDADGDGTPACEDCDDSNPDAYPGARWFLDRDGDGYGVQVLAEQCLPPEGFVNNKDDCDDKNPDVHPETVWYEDQDGDGFGNWNTSIQQCDQPNMYVFVADDCNDSDAAINPLTIWYRDNDLDGYGTDDDRIISCAPASGYVLNGGDCDDNNVDFSPRTEWLVDEDGDGYGGDTIIQSCEQPEGTSSIWFWDCDDTDPTINPTTQWYPDADGDGYGNGNLYVTQCWAPANYVNNPSDCNDGNSTVHPNAEEVCDGIDHNCDGDVGLDDCANCDAILDADPSATDGLFDVDVDGLGGEDTFEAYCDMSTDGGGWTLFWWFEAGSSMATVKDVLGRDIWDCDAANDASCFSLLPVSNPSEIMVVDGAGNWASWTFDSANSTSELVIDALTTGSKVAQECGDIWNPARQGGPSGTTPFACGSDSAEEGCSCFEYDSVASVWSFALDDNGDARDTAFSAGKDASGYLGVDAFDSGSNANSIGRSLQIYWR